MNNQEIKVENFENLLLELCELCSQNKQSLLGRIGMKQAKLIEMFKGREGIIHNQSNNGWIDIQDGGFDDRQEILITDGKEVWTDTVMFDCSDNDYYIYFDGSNPETVTHWQPLPKPPKE